MDFTKLTNYMDGLEKEHHIPASDIAVYRNNECIYRHAAGFSDVQRTKPMTGHEQFFLYSATKMITCTAAMILIDDGKLSLDDEAGEFYPEFNDMYVMSENGPVKAHNKLTVRALLSMQGGLSYDLNTAAIRKFKQAEHHDDIMAEAMAAIAASPLLFEPSTHFNYSLCHDVIGGIIEKASGMRFGEFLKTRIFDPIGMTHTRFGIDETDNPDFMEQYRYNDTIKVCVPTSKACEYTLIPGYESGGAGLVSCVDDYIRFCAMLANSGVTKDGTRIVSRERIDEMRTNMLSDKILKDFGRWNQGYGYGLGVRTMINKELCGAKSPLGEFGWDGAAGVYAMIDVDNNIALFYAQQVRDCGPVYYDVHPVLRDLVYECMGIEG